MHKNNKNSNMKKDFMNDEKKLKLRCEICEVYFAAKRSLNLHIASVHDKQKSYNCELCNTKFTQKVFSENSTQNTH